MKRANSNLTVHSVALGLTFLLAVVSAATVNQIARDIGFGTGSGSGLQSENNQQAETNVKKSEESQDLLQKFVECRSECRTGAKSCVETNCLTNPLQCLDTCVLHYDLCTYAKGCGNLAGPHSSVSFESEHQNEVQNVPAPESPESRSSNKFCIRFG